MSFYAQFSEYYESVFPFRSETFAFLKDYLPAGGGSVLDAGCGAGHYAGKFSDTGADAFGIDLDRQMIEYARTHYGKATFLLMNMPDIQTLHRRFDLIFSIGNVVSHLTSAQLGRFVTDACGMLSESGRWIFQVVNWDFILKAREYTFPEKKIGDGALTFLRRYVDISESGVTFQTALKSNERILFNEETTLYPVKTQEYISLHERAGFELTGHYCDYNRTPYAADANKANIMVFRKQTMRT